MPFFESSNGRVHFETIGSGPVLVLLHGFLENLEMWQEMLPTLSKSYQVVQIDLCGHGKSPVLKTKPAISLMAKSVNEVLADLKINRFMVVGHSMGGYVALELLKQSPDQIVGLCLYHSTASADSEEKRENRDRAIKAVNANKQDFIIAAIPQLFSPENQTKCAVEIENAIEVARRTRMEGILYCLKAMKLRNDHSKLVTSNAHKIFYVVGEYDSVLPLTMMQQEMQLVNRYHRIVLKDTGHMSHLEKPDLALKALKGVIGKMAEQS
jgi:pimeloyl-ACP methyl ester carboxylesterase